MAFDFPASPTVGQLYAPVAGVAYIWNGYAWALSSGASFNFFGQPQGRLSLQALPVMNSIQTGKTTVFYVPYVGNKVPIYDGANYVMTTFAILSAAITDTTKSPAAIGASKCNDWFVWNDAGTVRLGHGPDWTTDMARSVGTDISIINGLWVNSSAITNGPAAGRGTYVGTTRSNASSTLDWFYGGIGSGGSPGWFSVWNCYNRVGVSTVVGDTTVQWTYASAVIRPANGSNNMRVSAVFGLAEDSTNIAYSCAIQGSSGANGAIGVGIDSTTNFSGQWGFAQNASIINTGIGRASPFPLMGFHFWQALELNGNFWGGSQAYTQNGLFFDARM